MMKDLEILYLPIDSLTPYENNARKHTDFDVDAIAKSIELYGFNDSIGIWGDKNIIVEGHGRLLAAKKLGMDMVPCVRLDHLNDKERREYALVHNKTVELSEWQQELLENELLDLDFGGFDFGFELDCDEEFDEFDLDDDTIKENVVVSINIPNFNEYEKVKHEIQNIADTVNATVAVKMA